MFMAYKMFKITTSQQKFTSYSNCRNTNRDHQAIKPSTWIVYYCAVFIEFNGSPKEQDLYEHVCACLLLSCVDCGL